MQKLEKADAKNVKRKTQSLAREIAKKSQSEKKRSRKQKDMSRSFLNRQRVKLLDRYPNQVLMIERSLDDTVVVYVPDIDRETGRLTSVRPVAIDLQDTDLAEIDPSQHRGSQAFNMEIKPRKLRDRVMYELCMKAVMPKRKITVFVEDAKKQTVVAQARIGGRLCVVDRVYVVLRMDKLLGLVPTGIDEIQIYGVDPATDEQVSEHVDVPAHLDSFFKK